MDSLVAQADHPASPCRWSFDVFLSFRGEDTRFNFVSHLDIALRQKGINVFIDYKLPRGENISASLLKTIEESKVSIVIISENYASSSWCLDELTKIIECKECNKQWVFPIFYKVAPSDVGKHTGTFGEALAKHEINRPSNQMQAWRDALSAVSKLAGWDRHNFPNEANLIQDVLQKVLNVLNCTAPLRVATYPVGIDFQIQDMNLLSRIMSDSNMMIGIYGIGGMGKTTLAKALYNKIANQFEGCSFLANVREASKQFNGIIKLQEKLLSEILMGDLIKVSSSDKGINIIQERLQSKKILLVLDDVDTSQQLEELAGGHDWFGKGSKIIVTTRNKHLLSIQKFDVQHPIQELRNDKALELFSWHAFKKSYPSSENLNHSIRVVNYCKGLPLALVVLGSFFCGRDESTWEHTLGENERKLSLDKGIQDILQISYDGLDAQTQQIFLYISCLLVGEQINDAKMFLGKCGLCPEKGITNLMDQSFLTINKTSQEIEMHDLIQEMGCAIASSESANSRKRKILLTESDVEDVLNDNKEARAVKAIKLNFDQPTKLDLDIDARGLRNLKNLTFIKFENVTFSGDIEYLPNGLKWIDWSNFPLSSFPSSYTAKNLIQLRLQRSSIEDLRKAFMNCEWLKSVDLSGSEFLEEIPDFSGAYSLEKLKLDRCTNLVKVHESIGSLGKLAFLLLEWCTNLRHLPNYLKLRSLKRLNLHGCKNLENFPHIGEEMNSSKCTINLTFTAIRELSPSIEYLTGLKYLSLRYCRNLKTLPHTIYCLRSLLRLEIRDCIFPFSFPLSPSSNLCSKLTTLDLNNCKLSDASFLEDLSRAAPPLQTLDLSRNNISSLPSCIVNFTFLRKLLLYDCKLLEEISTIPLSVEEVRADGCMSLVRFPKNIIDVISSNMRERSHSHGKHYSYLNEERDGYKGRKVPLYSNLEFSCNRKLILMNYDVPAWYDHKNGNNSVRFWLPRYQVWELKALAPCVAFQWLYSPLMEDLCGNVYMSCSVYINDALVFLHNELLRNEYKPQPENTHLLVFHPLQSLSSPFHKEIIYNIFKDHSMELRNHRDQITVMFQDNARKFGRRIRYKSCGAHVAYKNDHDQ